jgi:hypothetical protein
MRDPLRRTSQCFLPLVISMLWVASGATQEVVVIPDEVSCPECQIDVEMVFELGGPGDTTNIGHTYFLPMDSKGRVYFQSVYFPGSIAVFDRQGEHIHTIGREGEGPGEFRSWAALFTSPGDSLFAFDSGLYRLSVFSPDFEFVRSGRIEPPLRPHDGFFRDDGSLLISSVGRGPQTFGRPLHIVDPSGRIRRSFGETEGIIAGGFEDALRRYVAPGDDGGSWAAHVYRYSIEHRGSGGELLKLIERYSDWGPDPTIESGLPGNPSDPPPRSLVTDIQVDDVGYLWMLVWVADEDWMAAFGDEKKRRSLHDLRDTIIEVLDPMGRRVVARTRIDELAMGFSAPGIMYTWDDREVFDKLKIWRLRLLTNPQQGE